MQRQPLDVGTIVIKVSDMSEVKASMGYDVTTVATLRREFGAPRERSLNVSLCSADGFCHVFAAVGSLDEVPALAARHGHPLVKVALSESYGQRYSHRQGCATWPTWTWNRAA